MSEFNHISASKDALRGRRIVITGAASGIGMATARRFLAEGAVVSLLDMNGPVLLEAYEGSGANIFAVDITQETSVAEAVAAAAQAMGGIDGLVNVAGIMDIGKLAEQSVERWRRQIDVNVVGTYLVTRACLPFLTQMEQASIVNVASAAGLLSNSPGLSAYAASKGAVIAFSRCLAAELAPAIRVNTVCPGMVDTPLAVGNGGNVANYALRRIAEPEEIAAAILFLTGIEASYITGAALAVDGGRSFH